MVTHSTLCLPILESTDFTGGVYSFTLQPAEQQTTISILITDDITVEQSEEQFSVSLSVQPQTGVSIGNSEVSVTIVDNDSELLTHNHYIQS